MKLVKRFTGWVLFFAIIIAMLYPIFPHPIPPELWKVIIASILIPGILGASMIMRMYGEHNNNKRLIIISNILVAPYIVAILGFFIGGLLYVIVNAPLQVFMVIGAVALICFAICLITS